MASTTNAFQLALFLLFVAVILFGVGFSTSHWYDSYEQYGLWQRCYDDDYFPCEYYSENLLSHWFRAVRGMETLGLIFLVTSAALVLLSVCGKEQQPRLRKMASSILMAVSGTCILIGVIVYKTHLQEDPDRTSNVGYSFWLCMSSGIILVITALLLLVDARIQKSEPPASSQAQLPVIYDPAMDTQAVHLPAKYPEGKPQAGQNTVAFQQAFTAGSPLNNPSSASSSYSVVVKPSHQTGNLPQY